MKKIKKTKQKHNYNITTQLNDNVFSKVIPYTMLNITDRTIWILYLAFIIHICWHTQGTLQRERH